ncbi:hypothetical protein OBBRIDRAFT_128782 [Obba rivulosa]|uniref:Uncharacterized protein n=1 Tax=Obba rivulosa TaxID=1052685 RepID=A0A8E2AR65_9APHY|nr:hypothetical protein OBBRIDRAFT_128782 [Obba rivulosa]
MRAGKVIISILCRIAIVAVVLLSYCYSVLLSIPTLWAVGQAPFRTFVESSPVFKIFFWGLGAAPIRPFLEGGKSRLACDYPSADLFVVLGISTLYRGVVG